MRSEVAAFRAIVMRDFRMYMSFRSALYVQAMSMVFTLALFYFVSRMVTVDRIGSPDDYFAFVAVGLIIISVIHSALGLAEIIRSELLTGTFERLLLSPFGPVLSIMSMTIFPMFRALMMAVWTLGVAAIVFGLDVQWSTAVLALPIGLLCAVAFAGIALLTAGVVMAFKRAPGIGFLVAGIALVSGSYFPVDLLPAWMRWMSEVQPFTPAVILLRHVLVGLPMPEPAALYLIKLVGFTALTLPVAAWGTAKGVEYAYQRGTMLEY